MIQPIVKVFNVDHAADITLSAGQIGVCVDVDGSVSLKLGIPAEDNVGTLWSDLPFPNASQLEVLRDYVNTQFTAHSTECKDYTDEAVADRVVAQIITWEDDD